MNHVCVQSFSIVFVSDFSDLVDCVAGLCINTVRESGCSLMNMTGCIAADCYSVVDQLSNYVLWRKQSPTTTCK